MIRDDLLEQLVRSIDDGHLQRSERRAARSTLAESELGPDDREWIRQGLFRAVADRLGTPRARELLDALEDSVRLLDPPQRAARREPVVRFGPDDPMVETLLQLVDGARRTLDIAVFTLTDDRLADAIVAAHARGVAVRILSDDDKSWDRGSDIRRLRDRGVEVRCDRSPYHFHHKFALIDGDALATGSYNWTRGADRDNRENFLVSWDTALVGPFREAFERMWRELA